MTPTRSPLPTIALCILTRDRPAQLADALASASGFDEIVVVDMASEPPLDPQPGTTWHREPVNLYLSRGWREVGRFRPEWLPESEEPIRVMILPGSPPEQRPLPSCGDRVS